MTLHVPHSGHRPARPVLPRATYRLQFNAGFTFDDARRLVPYLAELGVSHLYASPYLKAREGSTHGYDITDHNAFNPEIGDEDSFRASAGFGISWRSPMGPVRVDMAFPIIKEDFDEEENFRFSFGTRF